MFLNDDESEYQKTKTSENFNPKFLSKNLQFSNDLFEEEEKYDFFKYTGMININTLGSQPIIMYKKTHRLYSPKEENKIIKNPNAKSQEKVLINNFVKTSLVVDGGLPQKMNKDKS